MCYLKSFHGWDTKIVNDHKTKTDYVNEIPF